MNDPVDDDVLVRRARALAEARPAAAPASTSGEVVSFRVRRATYAIASELVLGVRKVDTLSPVPRGVGVAGLCVVEGEIVSVLRLDSVGPVEVEAGSLLVVLGRAKPELALLVDEVVDVGPLPVDASEAIVRLDGVALLRARTR